MAYAAFDTLKFSKRLIEAGFTQQQAETLAEEQASLVDERLATKADIKTLKTDMDAMEARITATILKWMFAAILGQTAMIVALVKLL